MANVIKAEPAAAVAAVKESRGVLATIADRLNLDAKVLTETLKKTAFATCKTNEQFVTMCVVTAKYGLNPLTKEIYAFPDRAGRVVPVVGVDGWIKIMNDHPAFDGIDFEETGDACTAIVHRKDRGHPTKVTEYLAECDRGTEPWKKWPRRMLRNKAIIQAARVAFGLSGIYDPDEAERIVDAQAAAEPAENGTRKRPASLREALAIPEAAAPVEAEIVAADVVPAEVTSEQAPEDLFE